jgi:hypothetical protein
LRNLCLRLLNRDLYKTILLSSPPDPGVIKQFEQDAMDILGIGPAELPYYVWVQTIENSAYVQNNSAVKILMKNGEVKDIAQASDLSNLEALSKKVQKYAISYPKELSKQSKIRF